MAVQRNQQETLLQQILAEFRGMNAEIAGLRVEMENFKQTLEPVTRIIRGDGTVQSLSTQIEVLRTQLGHMQATIVKNEEMIDDFGSHIDKAAKEDKKGKWVAVTAIMTGLFGLAAAIVALLVTMIKR